MTSSMTSLGPITMTSLLMTSSGSTDVALGNILKEQVFESRRSPFSELRRLSCGAHHATSFQQVQIQTDGIRPGLGMRLAVLHPDSLHGDSLHGDSLHGDQVCDLGFEHEGPVPEVEAVPGCITCPATRANAAKGATVAAIGRSSPHRRQHAIVTHWTRS